MRGIGATILLLAAVGAATWAGVVVLSGGFSLGRLVSRDPVRPFIIAAILAAIGRVVSPVDFDARVARIAGAHDRWPSRLAVLAAGAVWVVATAWNTRAAGGSDSSCYVLQADAFAHGHAVLEHPLAAAIPEAPPAVFAPTGFIPSRSDRGAAVPICAPGLAVLMAPFELAGGRSAVFLVVPIFAATAVWLTFALGRRLDDAVTGIAAAILVACSPIFLYQAVRPMSDVPAAALWLGALLGAARGDRAGQIAAGLCASVAVLTRPNLAVAVVPIAWLLRDRQAWIRFGAAALVALGALNTLRYGSPLASGYGEPGALFSFAHVAANVPRYGRWLIDTQSPLIVCAAAAPLILRGRPTAMVCAVAVMLVSATYLAYTVFDEWWCLRFLLPALPVLIVFMVIALRRVARVVPRPLFWAGVVAMAAWYGLVAGRRHVFDLQRLESRFALTGAYAARALPADAAVLAVQQSGSIRFYAGRPTLAWDAIPPDGLDALVERLRANGRGVFAALEDSEAEPFASVFPRSAAAG